MFRNETKLAENIYLVNINEQEDDTLGKISDIEGKEEYFTRLYLGEIDENEISLCFWKVGNNCDIRLIKYFFAENDEFITKTVGASIRIPFENLATKLLKNKVFKLTMTDLFGGEEIDIPMQNMIIRACGYAQDKISQSGNPQSVRIPEKKLTEKERGKALDLLRNPELFEIIDKELDREIKGENNNRQYVFLCITQAYTPDYLQVTGHGESSIGKSYLFGEVLKLFPEENFIKIGRLSKTALERLGDELKNIKIIYIQEARGKGQASNAIRLTSASDGGMTAYVTNTESGTVDKFSVPPVSIITTSTSDSLHHEDDTRNIIITLDASKEQTKRIIEHQAYLSEYPQELQQVTNKIDYPNRVLIQNAIRTLKKDVGVIIPFQTVVQKHLDISKVRLRRDNPKLQGHIKTLAFLHQFQRDRIRIENKYFVIATKEDLKKAIKLSEKQLTQSYYSINDLDREVLTIINDLNNNEEMKTNYPNGIPSEEVVKEADIRINRKRSWVYEVLEKLRNKTLIYVTSKSTNNVLFYKINKKQTDSIFKDKIDYSAIDKRTYEWYVEIEKAIEDGKDIEWYK